MTATTFQLRELTGARTGQWRLDSAEGSDSPVAGLPVVQVKAGAALGAVRDPAGHTVLWAKQLGFGGEPVGDPVRVSAVAVPQGAPVPATQEQVAEQIATALEDFTPESGTSVAPVSAGSVAGTARPDTESPVYWTVDQGTVPTNAVAGDLIFTVTVPEGVPTLATTGSNAGVTMQLVGPVEAGTITATPPAPTVAAEWGYLVVPEPLVNIAEWGDPTWSVYQDLADSATFDQGDNPAGVLYLYAWGPNYAVEDGLMDVPPLPEGVAGTLSVVGSHAGVGALRTALAALAARVTALETP